MIEEIQNLSLKMDELIKVLTPPNQIVINYQDIEGNKYFTIESENFDQKSFKGKR